MGHWVKLQLVKMEHVLKVTYLWSDYGAHSEMSKMLLRNPNQQ